MTRLPSQQTDTASPGAARRWGMLGVGTAAQAASAVSMHGAPFLIPALRSDLGLTLPQAGAVVAAPTVGVMLTLIAWGYVVDRVGERFVLVLGLVLTAVAGLAATTAQGPVTLALFLFLAGAAAASSNSASGRVVVGWFPPRRRGLAMGIRQMAQPLGVGLAAVTLPVVAESSGISTALLVPPALAAVTAVACLVVVIDPPRTARAEATDDEVANPYRRDRFLWRVHGVSVLLVVPQFTVWTYTLVWLVSERGWSTAAAGTLVALTQVLGALGRAAAGQLSDVVGSRMRPLRWVAVAAALATAALGAAAGLDWAVAVPLVVLASVLSVADNGLAFTAVAERSGPFWSGRALGAQNTAQFLAASAVPPLVGTAITGLGYPAAFALAALAPVLAIPLVPVRDERALS
ncbi:MFS transporter [Solicola sp. PLA-1-18]|uniref:MFS transporter n=1 Tax=Solicola sp. PLA-1-18 TaxID=3380532 RepID=UPI003B826D2F